jgi:hypothetical protein
MIVPTCNPSQKVLKFQTILRTTPIHKRDLFAHLQTIDRRGFAAAIFFHMSEFDSSKSLM